MANGITEWMAALHRGRIFDIERKDVEHAVPIVPWIHPPLHPELQRLLIKMGQRVRLDKNQKLTSTTRKIHHLAMVTQGVTARNFGSPTVTPKGAAISPVGHIALGNLNFFTGRAAIGHYFALTKAEVTVVDKELLLPILKTEPELFSLLLKHFECGTLSDRLGFSLYAFGSVELRLKCFIISWAIEFAEVFYKGGEMWLRMPTPLTRINRCLVTNASSVSIDNCLKKWMGKGVWSRGGDFTTCQVDFFEDGYLWMRESEEQSEYRYPATLKELFSFLPALKARHLVS